MSIVFSKYQGAGNDFILINDLNESFPKNDNTLISKLCDRRFGVGADGLILLRSSDVKDFRMLYFNSDGFEGTMCGNGGRCIVAFAKECGCISKSSNIVFDAIDGEHRAEILISGNILLKMKNVDKIVDKFGGYLVDTGSPHFVKYVEGLADLDVFTRGKEIKTNKKCFPEGCNVNFVEDMGEALLAVRTYERGVEAETLSCGTGSIAAAIVQHHCGTVFDKYHIKAKGGNLAVTFTYDEQRGYENVCLEGPAELVFKGEYQL